ncbi:MAG TPA: efflux RND transporter periplasmic adaptor subunit [Polyangiaceae bacterium]|jgi:RND family efflux transporter MFP subunit|nr:efflux RND transporter periplasmic adaptor subunit [Polyangiaceae bacterium]
MTQVPQESGFSSISGPQTAAIAAPSGVAPRAPLSGILVGVALVLGFVGWTSVRIHAANQALAAVSSKRADDARKAVQDAAAPQKVHTVRASPEIWQPLVEFEGSLQAAQSAALGFKVNGRISAVRVKLGQIVKAGTLLGTLDSSEAGAQVRSAEAQTRAAQAQLALADDNAARTAAIVKSGALAEAMGVQAEQQRSLASAQLDAAKAGLSLSQVNLGNQNLVAPFQGTITRVPDGVGAVVSPSAVEFEIMDLSSLKLKASVGESDANLVHVGSVVEISGEHGTVNGVVSALLGAVDPNTRRVPLEALIDNRNEKTSLRSGSFVRARIAGGAPLPVLHLPHETLRPGSQDEVMIESGGTLSSRHLTFALAKDGSLLVRQGLDATDDVVLSPKPEAKTGDRVVVEGAGQ